MTENPYQPVETREPVAARVRRRVWVMGGPFTVTLVGLLAGYLIGWAFDERVGPRLGILGPILIPAACMLFASAACVRLIRGISLPIGLQATLVVGCTFACWLLFFPACIAGGLGAMAVGFEGRQYGPNRPGVFLACLFGSSTALNLVFWLLLVILRRRGAASDERNSTEA